MPCLVTSPATSVCPCVRPQFNLLLALPPLEGSRKESSSIFIVFTSSTFDSRVNFTPCGRLFVNSRWRKPSHLGVYVLVNFEMTFWICRALFLPREPKPWDREPTGEAFFSVHSPALKQNFVLIVCCPFLGGPSLCVISCWTSDDSRENGEKYGR